MRFAQPTHVDLPGSTGTDGEKVIARENVLNTLIAEHATNPQAARRAGPIFAEMPRMLLTEHNVTSK